MTTAPELRALIEAIEAGPVSRELEDRVLLACTKWTRECVLARDPQDPGSGTVWQWTDQKGRIQGIYRPSPLTSLDDAKLAVPEGHDWSIGWSATHGLEAHVQLPARNGPCHSGYAPEGDETDKLAARALVLAGLRARLAEMER